MSDTKVLVEEKETIQSPALSYEFERKAHVIDSGGIYFKKPQPISPYVELVAPNQVRPRIMYEEEESEVSKLQKVRTSFQNVERFSGRLGAAFAKRSPQIGILDNSKRKPSTTKVTVKKRTKNLFGL